MLYCCCIVNCCSSLTWICLVFFFCLSLVSLTSFCSAITTNLKAKKPCSIRTYLVVSVCYTVYKHSHEPTHSLFTNTTTNEYQRIHTYMWIPSNTNRPKAKYTHIRCNGNAYSSRTKCATDSDTNARYLRAEPLGVGLCVYVCTIFYFIIRIDLCIPKLVFSLYAYQME